VFCPIIVVASLLASNVLTLRHPLVLWMRFVNISDPKRFCTRELLHHVPSMRYWRLSGVTSQCDNISSSIPSKNISSSILGVFSAQ
jgi:hypothetical protein